MLPCLWVLGSRRPERSEDGVTPSGQGTRQVSVFGLRRAAGLEHREQASAGFDDLRETVVADR